MRIKMKTLLLLGFLLFISLNINAEEACEKKVSKAEAKKIAVLFLEQQEWADKYIKDPEPIIENRCQWIVSFKHINWNKIKPAEGWVAVHQTSGHAKWIPLR